MSFFINKLISKTNKHTNIKWKKKQWQKLSNYLKKKTVELSVPWSWGCSTALCAQVPPEESWAPGSSGTGLQDHRRYKLQSETQKQQNYVTPKVTRWQKASTRTLPTKTKATWHHQKPVLPPQQVLDNWIYDRARFEFKITLHDADRGLQDQLTDKWILA